MKENAKRSFYGGKLLFLLFFFLLLGVGGLYWKRPDLLEKFLKQAKQQVKKTPPSKKSAKEQNSKAKNNNSSANSSTEQNSKVEKDSQENLKVTLRVRHVTFTVEVADTREKRRIGLMFRKSLPENHGMVFVYPEPEYLTFWMKNTFIPLSLAFLDEQGKILEILHMEVEEPKKEGEKYREYSSSTRVKYAIEMPLGWFEKHGIQVGDVVEGVTKLVAKE